MKYESETLINTTKQRNETTSAKHVRIKLLKYIAFIKVTNNVNMKRNTINFTYLLFKQKYILANKIATLLKTVPTSPYVSSARRLSLAVFLGRKSLLNQLYYRWVKI